LAIAFSFAGYLPARAGAHPSCDGFVECSERDVVEFVAQKRFNGVVHPPSARSPRTQHQCVANHLLDFAADDSRPISQSAPGSAAGAARIEASSGPTPKAQAKASDQAAGGANP
jgi:hypothetical protein